MVNGFLKYIYHNQGRIWGGGGGGATGAAAQGPLLLRGPHGAHNNDIYVFIVTRSKLLICVN